MIDVIFPKRAPSPRERDTRPVPSDYRPKPLRAEAVAQWPAEAEAPIALQERVVSTPVPVAGDLGDLWARLVEAAKDRQDRPGPLRTGSGVTAFQSR